MFITTLTNRTFHLIFFLVFFELNLHLLSAVDHSGPDEPNIIYSHKRRLCRSLASQVVDLVINGCTCVIVEVVPVVLRDDTARHAHGAAVYCAHAHTSVGLLNHSASRSTECLSAHHEVTLLLLLHLTNGSSKAILYPLCQISKLVQVVAHLLLVLELGGHHASFQLLLLLEGSRLAGFTGLFECCETVADAFLVHRDALFEYVECAGDDVKLRYDLL